jgi:hypothetical protein
MNIYTRLIACLVVLAALAAALYAAHSKGETQGRAEVQAKWDKETKDRQAVVIQAQAKTAAIEHQQAAKAAEVDTHAQDQLKAALADRDRAVSAIAGLRSTLSAIRGGTLPKASADPGQPAQVAALSDSLSECSQRYSEVASQSDALSIQVSGLLALVGEPTP